MSQCSLLTDRKSPSGSARQPTRLDSGRSWSRQLLPILTCMKARERKEEEEKCPERHPVPSAYPLPTRSPLPTSPAEKTAEVQRRSSPICYFCYQPSIQVPTIALCRSNHETGRPALDRSSRSFSVIARREVFVCLFYLMDKRVWHPSPPSRAPQQRGPKSNPSLNTTRKPVAHSSPRPVLTALSAPASWEFWNCTSNSSGYEGLPLSAPAPPSSHRAARP